MSLDAFTKITYHHSNGKKICFYRDLSGFDVMVDTLAILDKMIQQYLTNEHKLQINGLRKYWIDKDGDEIAIANPGDFSLYFKGQSRHIHCDSLEPLQQKETQAEVKASPEEPKAAPSSSAPTNQAVHFTVSCDGCQMAPLVGYRYKCVECKNYDLCEKCESEHKHPDHMMLRIPRNLSQFDIDFRIVPTRRGRYHQKSGGGCPFYVDISTKESDAENGATGETGHCGRKKHHHHHGGRKSDRRSMRHGIFTHLYDMMHDLAEGGGSMERGEEAPQASAGEAEKKKERKEAKTAEKESPAVNPFAEFLKEAQEIAKNNMQVASEQMKVAEQLASEQQQPKEEKKTQTEEPVATKTTASGETSATPSSEGAVQPSLYPFENLSQIVDPQYMKAGIQILNNFSEMFAKMLDPEVEAPINSPLSSMSVSSSSSSSKSSTEVIPTPAEDEEMPEVPHNPEEAEKAAAQKQQDGAQKDAEPAQKQQEPETEKKEEPAQQVAAAPSLGAIPRRSPSADDNDWQLVDKKQVQSPLESFDHVSDTDSVQGAVGGEAAAAEEPPTSSVATQCESPKKQAEDIVYHKDPVINNAVINMMTMGFSNEGAWLTQLLESVKGNIPAALDIMSNAQRHV